MKPSLIKLIYDEILLRDYCQIDVLYAICEREHYKYETMSRKARELTNMGSIKPRMKNGAIIGYEIVKIADLRPVKIQSATQLPF